MGKTRKLRKGSAHVSEWTMGWRAMKSRSAWVLIGRTTVRGVLVVVMVALFHGRGPATGG